MSGEPDIRGLVHSVCYPSGNESYIRDQKSLTDLFKEPGFFVALQELALDTGLDHNERLFASVITGREMKTKWRGKVLIPEDQKEGVRQRLLAFLEEPDFSIARPQLSLLVTIARIELPNPWTSLPQTLLQRLSTCLSHLSSNASSSATSTVLVNTLWTINALVKEWRSVKLTAGAQVMRSLELLFYGPVYQVLELWGSRETAGEVDWYLNEAGRYAFKILGRFGNWHWSKAKNLQPQEALQNIQRLVQHSVHYAPVIQQHRLRLVNNPSSENTKLLRSLIKHLRAIGKWWRTMIALDAKGYCQLDQAVQGVGWWWGEVGGVVAGSDGAVVSDDGDTIAYPKRFLLLGMLLFKDILPILAVDHQNIFNGPFILHAFHLLLDKLLPLTSTDLENLEEEPEEWLVAENNDEEAWAFEFRPCAERVLIALNNACRNLPPDSKVIEPEMLKVLAEVEASSPNDLPAILRRESVYCALGRLSRSLASFGKANASGGIDFNAFLQHASTWLTQGIPLHRILKRRLAWLIGEWVGSDEECAKLPLVWQILVHLLGERGESSDMAVRLTAALAIKECVDLWEMPIDYFMPYLQPSVEESIKLLGEATTLPGKKYITTVIGVMIERVGEKILPFLPTLASSIPALWHGASGLEGEWLFKASLVDLTTKIVIAARTSSGQLMELVIPLIEESLVPPAKEYFEEDGLILWRDSLRHASSLYEPSAEKGLIRLLPGLMGMVGENMDLLVTSLDLLDSYLLLDAPGILQNYGPALCSTMYKALTVTKLPVAQLNRVLATLILLIRTAPLQSLAGVLLDAGLFQHVITALDDDKASGQILASYLSILSRIAMIDPNVFLQMVAENARRGGRDGEKDLGVVLDALWRNFDYVGDARSRKAVAMGVGALLTTGNPSCLERLDGEFMNIFLDVLGEVQAPADEPTSETNVRHWKDEHQTLWGEIEGSAEGQRRQTLEDSDPAYGVPLKGYVVQVLTRAGEVGMGPYWDKADAGTKASLEKFLA